MKIAIIHYRYFPGDGPERYLLNIKEILEREGHHISVFSVENSRNVESPTAQYFLPGVDDEVHYGDKTRTSPLKAVRSLIRMYYSPGARRRFGRMLDDVRPDLVYILQYHNKISPSVIDAAHSRGIPVVHRISDFQYMCPNALFFANGQVCEACLEGRGMQCIRQRCVHGSLAMSALKLGAKRLHDMLHVTRRISAFVVPSAFTLGKLEQYGIPPERLHHIPTFFNTATAPATVTPPPANGYFLYIGRLEPQKGIDTMLRAFVGTTMPLKIVGTTSDPSYAAHLDTLLQEAPHNIEMLGYKNFSEIAPLLQGAIATIVPSEWYDNFPNSVLESYGFGRPVIASAQGSLLEMVRDGYSGYTFHTASAADLRRVCQTLLTHPEEAVLMGRNAHHLAQTEYSAATHYHRLMELFNSLVK